MPQTTYTYSIATDFGGNTPSVDDLTERIEASSVITKVLDYISVGVSAADNVNIVFADALPAAEKTELDSIVSGLPPTATDFRKRFMEEEFSQNKIVRRSWYANRVSEGVYQNKVEESTFTYQGNNLISEVFTEYASDGQVASGPTTYDYFTDQQGNTKWVRKEEQ